ncbi:TonB-dependent receptor plug domain-containing protein [Halomonas sp. 22501_18_FS]|uniref:TonB-dependent receptor plug domain-containing protein n=1 Tax=Vreelandella halophila TaxID=86177 RepID=A0A9X4YDN2_9GAMM|nr:TonB-dependent receptor plug domain-containing protein [Halomonas utahensis]MYL75063.1 TonB-dependent receptor plug domain-containing protein [Halomonas sp. 22501_18_FS]
MTDRTRFKRNRLALVIGLHCAIAFPGVALGETSEDQATSESEDMLELDRYQAQDRVDDPMGMMPTEPVESVFGFDKTLMETPRGATSVSADMMENFEIESINDLALIAPGSFRQSFFGVGGSLDVRGNPGENYFRGVRRLNNPGNFPTPIAASDRVDVVRGPASPIMGPSKIGGYLNFVPKSARVETGQYLDEPTGEMSLTKGSWDKNILRAEVGGPGELGGQDFGYYLYGEAETSDDYYRNTDTDQSVMQASFNTAFSSSTRIEFGGMRQDFDGNQVAGWNRVTQDLIDNGTYTTGLAPDLDTNNDGRLSRGEFKNADFENGVLPFFPVPSAVTEDDFGPDAELENSGTAQLDGDEVLVAPEDRLESDVTTLYFDLIHDMGRNAQLKNKTFYESLDSINENAYGFSSNIDSWVVENQTIFSFDVDHADWLDGSHQISPSIRYTEYERGNDFGYEFFDRRDLTQPSTPRDKRLLSTQSGENFDDYQYGSYTNYGLAYLGDFTIADRVGLLLGTRYDYVDFNAKRDASKIDPDLDPGVLSADDSDSEVSWTASLNYQTDWGVTPYVTVSEQATVISDQGSEVSPDLIADGDAMATSELEELGVKADLLNGRLFLAGAWFKQERTNFNAQDLTSNNTTETEGYEFEARLIATDNLTLTAAYTNLEVINLTALENGSQFSFLGAEDLPNVDDPSQVYGNQPGGLIPVSSESDARKAGVPEHVYSVTGAYQFGNGFGMTTSVQHVDSVYSGFSKSVRLPAYTLVNAGVNYRTGPWKFDVQVRNVTDEDYFRSNFPDLFGSTVVKPERPRNWTASLSYSF